MNVTFLDLEDDGFSHVITTLEHADHKQSLLKREGQTYGVFTVLTKTFEENWEGVPGYSANLKYHELRCGALAQTCE
jgi:hypothetical protein